MENQWLDLVVAVLATYRLSEMLADPHQVGPAGGLQKLRESHKIFVVNGEGKKDVLRRYQPGSFGHLIDCPKCSSIWFAAIVLAMMHVGDVSRHLAWLYWVAVGLAVAGAVVLIFNLQSMLDDRDQPSGD